MIHIKEGEHEVNKVINSQTSDITISPKVIMRNGFAKRGFRVDKS